MLPWASTHAATFTYQGGGDVTFQMAFYRAFDDGTTEGVGGTGPLVSVRNLSTGQGVGTDNVQIGSGSLVEGMSSWISVYRIPAHRMVVGHSYEILDQGLQGGFNIPPNYDPRLTIRALVTESFLLSVYVPDGSTPPPNLPTREEPPPVNPPIPNPRPKIRWTQPAGADYGSPAFYSNFVGTYPIGVQGRDAGGDLSQLKFSLRSAPAGAPNPGGPWYWDGNYWVCRQDLGGVGSADFAANYPFTVPGNYHFVARAKDQGNARSSTTIEMVVTITNRSPTVNWTTGGISQINGNTWQIQTTVGQPVQVSGHGHDDDGNLATLLVNGPGGVPHAHPGGGNGFDVDGGNPANVSQPGVYFYTIRAEDRAGASSETLYLRVEVINRPPTISWAVPGAVPHPNGDPRYRFVLINRNDVLDVRARAQDPDGNLSAIWIDQAHHYPPVGGFGFAWQPVGGADASAGGNWSTGTPGDYWFSARAGDHGNASSEVIHLQVRVNAPPTINWSVAGAYQVNGNTWILDVPGATSAPRVTAISNDPEARLAATRVNRGVGDPSHDQGTPHAHSGGVEAGNPLTEDEMRPPLSQPIEGSGFDGGAQYNYAWFSAAAMDQDGARSTPIHLLVRVWNQAPSVANWVAPAGLTAVAGNPNDLTTTAFVNSPAQSFATLSSDPERKMFGVIINRGRIIPRVGNADGSEISVGYAPADGGPATAVATLGAELWDVPGSHTYSSIGIDRGYLHSGGANPSPTHLRVDVVNRTPTARFVALPGAVNVNDNVSLRGAGQDPDRAMRRVRVEVVSAPAPSGMTAGQSVAEQTADAAQQTYPSNLPDLEAPGNFVPSWSGTYRLRTVAFDRHGAQAQQESDLTVVNRPPVFRWGQDEVRVLAGDTAQLPFGLSDPDGNLGRAVASGPNGFAGEVPAPNAATGQGAFPFPTTVAGTFIVTGRGYDRENLPGVDAPTITVVVEPRNVAPVAVFLTPEPGGADSLVTRFVDDVVQISARGTDADTNLTGLDILWANQPWNRTDAGAGDIGALNGGAPFTVPALGAESYHDHVFQAVAHDRGRVAGGQLAQPPRDSAPARLVVRVPNRAPSVRWTLPTGGVGLDPANPYVGYLLQPLRVTAEATDRDRNLSSVLVRQQGGSGGSATAPSADGRGATASVDFVPTMPGLYVFEALAVDQAGLDSGAPLPIYLLVRDYPGGSQGVLGAVILSGASKKEEVFRNEGLPVILRGGIAAIGRQPVPAGVAATRRGPQEIRPVPAWLSGAMIPPLVLPILDLRTVRVEPAVDHENPAGSAAVAGRPGEGGDPGAGTGAATSTAEPDPETR